MLSAPTRWVARASSLGAATGDQALAALRPLYLAIFLANVLPAAEFGVFIVVQTTVNLLRGTTVALTAQVLLVRPDSLDDPARRWRSFQVAASFAAIAAIVLLALAMVAPTVFVLPLLLSALCGPVLALAEYLRLEAYSRRRPGTAARISATFLLLTVVGTLAASSGGDAALVEYVVIWSVAGGLAAAPDVGRAIRHRSGRHSWASEDGRLGGTFAGEFLLLTGSSQASAYLVAAFLGPTLVGALGAIQVLLAPIGSWIQVVRNQSLPVLAKRRRTGGGSRTVAVVRLAVAGPVTVYLAATLVLGDFLGPLLFPSTWTDAVPALAGFVAAALARAISATSLMEVQLAGDGRLLLSLRATDSIVTVAALIIGLRYGDLIGLSIGHAVANWMMAPVWLVCAHRVRVPATTVPNSKIGEQLATR